jgi:hypothetical protein
MDLRDFKTVLRFLITAFEDLERLFLECPGRYEIVFL